MGCCAQASLMQRLPMPYKKKKQALRCTHSITKSSIQFCTSHEAVYVSLNDILHTKRVRHNADDPTSLWASVMCMCQQDRMYLDIYNCIINDGFWVAFHPVVRKHQPCHMIGMYREMHAAGLPGHVSAFWAGLREGDERLSTR